ncbi:NAD(P)-dependent oxidoreductase [Roseateles sp.]|uniref:NAD-dependent epimerase/dehydratase family protein n=1 Tax=Roseateles sp. TaxID=1971397 RepID=UPI0025EA572E|nr:NAD(P)-dependent oxidoreductase [Roseateles sp.]MBV8037220.1 NAD(P)-dependent oxidoreductase [Roseateles sp.]
MTSKPFQRLLLTGAAGGVGRVLRDAIKPWTEILRVSDIADLGPAREGEEVMQCDLADGAAVRALVEGVDAVLHFGGISTDDRFEPIMQANILGVYNLYASVHQAGVKRVIYASSSHTVGFYRTTERVDASMPLRPDGFYGVSKCFGEALSRYYFDRFGIETVCLRIGSSHPQPKTARMMTTYLSYRDLIELVRCSLFTPRVDHTIAFGTSDNAASWWDNREAAHLGYAPVDSSREYSHLFPPTAARPDPADQSALYQGGPFITDGPKY